MIWLLSLLPSTVESLPVSIVVGFTWATVDIASLYQLRSRFTHLRRVQADPLLRRKLCGDNFTVLSPLICIQWVVMGVYTGATIPPLGLPLN